MFSSSSLTPTPPCPLPPATLLLSPCNLLLPFSPSLHHFTADLQSVSLRAENSQLCCSLCCLSHTWVPPASRHPRLTSSSPPPRHFLPVTHFYKDEWVQKREKKREDAGQSNTSSHSPSLSRSLFPVETHWLSIIISACSDFQGALSCFFCSFLNLLVCMRVWGSMWWNDALMCWRRLFLFIFSPQMFYHFCREKNRPRVNRCE